MNIGVIRISEDSMITPNEDFILDDKNIVKADIHIQAKNTQILCKSAACFSVSG